MCGHLTESTRQLLLCGAAAWQTGYPRVPAYLIGISSRCLQYNTRRALLAAGRPVAAAHGLARPRYYAQCRVPHSEGAPALLAAARFEVRTSSRLLHCHLCTWLLGQAEHRACYVCVVSTSCNTQPVVQKCRRLVKRPQAFDTTWDLPLRIVHSRGAALIPVTQHCCGAAGSLWLDAAVSEAPTAPSQPASACAHQVHTALHTYRVKRYVVAAADPRACDQLVGSSSRKLLHLCIAMLPLHASTLVSTRCTSSAPARCPVSCARLVATAAAAGDGWRAEQPEASSSSAAKGRSSAAWGSSWSSQAKNRRKRPKQSSDPSSKQPASQDDRDLDAAIRANVDRAAAMLDEIMQEVGQEVFMSEATAYLYDGPPDVTLQQVGGSTTQQRAVYSP